MKLYTKTGDDGTTGLQGGGRVRKDDIRVAAYGDVDETNSAIGLAVAACKDDVFSKKLLCIQSDLFTLGAELAVLDGSKPALLLADARIRQLELWIDDASASTTPLRSFVLPGGCELAARLHVARSVCRRAERSTVMLASQRPVRDAVLIYLNRLSDFLFALARLANQQAGVSDIPWSAETAKAGDDPDPTNEP